MRTRIRIKTFHLSRCDVGRAALFAASLTLCAACDGSATTSVSHAGAGGSVVAESGGGPGAAPTGAGGALGASGAAPNSSTGGASKAGGQLPGSGGGAGIAGSPGTSGAGSGTGGGAGTSGAPGTGGASSSGGSGSAGAGGAASTADTGVFPPITDPGTKGPFTPTTVSSTGPMNGYTAFLPMELGKNGLKHPIVIWGNGATATPSNYLTLLNHLASHGFAILAYNTTPQGPQMTAAIDWMIAENTRQGSTYLGKLDTTKIAAMGHSAGSLATFQIAADARLTTTMHLDGGTMAPHTDNQNLKKPAAFICGDSGGDGLITGDLARPNCDIDFMDAMTPVWYGDVVGASHLTVATAPATDPKMAKGFLAATAAWLRWQLAADTTMKKLFVGPSCDLCSDKAVWTVQQKNLM